MVRLTKIYTRRGDDGETDLLGGARVQKTSLRLEAGGVIDEVNCLIGVLRTQAESSGIDAIVGEAEATLQQIQNDLFDIGSLVATAHGAQWDGMTRFTEERVQYLEGRIDTYLASLANLDSFVLPGGTEVNATAHLARAVCRKAERALWHLHVDEPVDLVVLKYINRLSDLFFVFARWAAQHQGGTEFLWDTEISRGS
jgi:cob(I)alamin adenosyltransferase